MLATFGLICVVINLFGIAATLFIRDFPSPGGKLVNVLFHVFGISAGLSLLR